MKISHITIQTRHFDAEIAFYEKYTGMTVQQDMRPMGRNMVFLADNKDATQIEIIENLESEDIATPHLSIGFHTADIDALHRELSEAGFEVTPFVTPMPQVRFFFVKDPAGMNIQFM